MTDAAPEVVDLAFALDGSRLPAAHAAELAAALLDALPWLASEPLASIHPLRTSPSAGGDVLLARRARLVLRVPATRIAEARALDGRSLDVAGRRLAVGAASPRTLSPAPTLYASRVASAAADDRAFHDEVADWLAAERLGGRPIAGRPRPFATGSGEITVRGLALHGLPPADALRVLRAGYGPLRLLGCGVFLPHKAIAVAE